MALLLQQQAGCPNTYLDLYQPLLVPQLWEAGGNVQPLVRLLSTIIEKNPAKPAEKVKNISTKRSFRKFIDDIFSCRSKIL